VQIPVQEVIDSEPVLGEFDSRPSDLAKAHRAEFPERKNPGVQSRRNN
jgi:hypothetical protein